MTISGSVVLKNGSFIKPGYDNIYHDGEDGELHVPNTPAAKSNQFRVINTTNYSLTLFNQSAEKFLVNGGEEDSVDIPNGTAVYVVPNYQGNTLFYNTDQPSEYTGGGSGGGVSSVNKDPSSNDPNGALTISPSTGVVLVKLDTSKLPGATDKDLPQFIILNSGDSALPNNMHNATVVEIVSDIPSVYQVPNALANTRDIRIINNSKISQSLSFISAQFGGNTVEAVTLNSGQFVFMDYQSDHWILSGSTEQPQTVIVPAQNGNLQMPQLQANITFFSPSDTPDQDYNRSITMSKPVNDAGYENASENYIINNATGVIIFVAQEALDIVGIPNWNSNRFAIPAKSRWSLKRNDDSSPTAWVLERVDSSNPAEPKQQSKMAYYTSSNPTISRGDWNSCCVGTGDSIRLHRTGAYREGDNVYNFYMYQGSVEPETVIPITHEHSNYGFSQVLYTQNGAQKTRPFNFGNSNGNSFIKWTLNTDLNDGSYWWIQTTSDGTPLE